MVYYRSLGSATTDANGVATITYSAKGMGEVDIIASTSSTISSSSLDSDDFILFDAMIYDGATSDNTSNFTNTQRGTLSFDTDRYVLDSSSVDGCFTQIEPSQSLVPYYLGKRFRFTCDIIEATALMQIRIYQYIDGRYRSVASSTATSGTLTVDGNIDPTATRVLFRVVGDNLGDGGSCSFRNFKVYQI